MGFKMRRTDQVGVLNKTECQFILTKHLYIFGFTNCYYFRPNAKTYGQHFFGVVVPYLLFIVILRKYLQLCIFVLPCLLLIYRMLF
jgi:hypothetical protein